MVFGCMLAKKESQGKKKTTFGVSSSGILVYISRCLYVAHMWLHHPNSGKGIGPVVRRHECKPLFFSGS